MYRVKIDPARCRLCGRCVENCSFDALELKDRIIQSGDCVACLRCIYYCPENAITVEKYELSNHAVWTHAVKESIIKQANTGGVLIGGMGTPKPYPILWDHILIDACQVTNPPIDPLREPMELRTYLGRKPEHIDDELLPLIKLDIPVIFAAMSYGAVSLNVHRSLAAAANRAGTLMNTGEGGLHPDLYPYQDCIMVQCASGRFGVDRRYFNHSVAIEIKIGQGAKPGIGGHLPGEKICADISCTRMIPVGTDAISPAPHHDIYSIEDLSQLIYALKEITDYKKPVSVKIAAVHNVSAIASGVVRAGADIITIDGFKGGTGAAPTVIRDNVGIPIEIALAVVDQRLREEGIRNQATIISGGGIRNSGDVVKAIALGADAVMIGTAALVALGCKVCGQCFTGKCAWGIATQEPELVKRLDPAEGEQRLVNLLHAWGLEIKEVLGALGMNSIESLRGNRERLRGIDLDATTLNILGIKPAGEGQ